MDRISVVQRYVLLGPCIFLLPAFKNKELSVNIQIPSLSENTQKTIPNASMAIILLLRTAPPHNLPVTTAP